MKIVSGILLLIFLGVFLELSGQFYGGNYDGFGGSSSGFIILNQQYIYCNGGPADGNATSNLPMTTMFGQSLYTAGGNADGFGLFHFNREPINSQVEYCNGGSEDGSATSLFNGWLFPPYFYLGGAGDGWNGTSSGTVPINLQYFYCNAGPGDGYGSLAYSGSLLSGFLHCGGGAGDGYGSFSPGVLNMGYGIWTGLSSGTWTVASNWKYNTVPTVNTNVVIPAGAPNYPNMLNPFSVGSGIGIYICNRLDVLAGGQLSSSSFVTIDGIMNISGTMTFQQQGANTLQINSGGELHVKPGGTFSLE